MKVLGISFGRKLGNTEVMVKQALKVCENAGHAIKFIRADDLNIKPCTGFVYPVLSAWYRGMAKANAL